MVVSKPRQQLDAPNALSHEQARRLRIAVISDAIVSRNGVGTYYEGIAEHLRGRIEEIAILAPQAVGRGEPEWFSLRMPGDGTQRIAFPRPNGIRRVLQDLRPHVVVLPTLGPYTLFGARAARRLGIAICAAHHTDFRKLVDLYWSGMFATVSRSVLRRLSTWIISQANVVTAVNVESLEDARACGAVQPRLVGTPISKCFLDTPQTPVGNPPRRVAYVGRLSPEKRIERLVAAAQQLSGFHFDFAGDGPLRPQLERAARTLPNIRCHGWVDQPQVLQIIDQSDIVVLPSSLETFGTAALEALARRRYVVVSRECGIANWPDLAQGLFTFESHESLASVLLRVSSLPAAQRNAIAARGWESARGFHRASIDHWLSILCEAAGTALQLETDRCVRSPAE